MSVNLLDFDSEGLAAWLIARGEKPFRARQLMRWIHRDGESDLERMTDLSKTLRASLADEVVITAPEVTSDSIAAWVAGAIGARRLVLIKPPQASGGNLVDAYFARALPPGIVPALVRADQDAALDAALRTDDHVEKDDRAEAAADAVEEREAEDLSLASLAHRRLPR